MEQSKEYFQDYSVEEKLIEIANIVNNILLQPPPRLNFIFKVGGSINLE